MMKLIRLEWMKNNTGKYILKAVLLTVIIGLFVLALAFLGIANDPDGTLDAAPGAEGISTAVELFANMAYLLMTSSMFGSFIINSYKNRTMELMYTYPIRRQKILASQMLAVWLFCFVASILSKLLIYAVVAAGAGLWQSSFVIDVDPGSLSFYQGMALRSFVTVSLGFICLFAGLAMKSSRAALLTAFFLFFITQGNVGDFSLAGNRVFMLTLTVISFVLAGVVICRAGTGEPG